VNVGLPEVRTADDAGNFPRDEPAANDALPGGKDGACVVMAVPLRLITEVNDELGDWERGVCLTGADTIVLTGS